MDCNKCKYNNEKILEEAKLSGEKFNDLDLDSQIKIIAEIVRSNPILFEIDSLANKKLSEEIANLDTINKRELIKLKIWGVKVLVILSIILISILTGLYLFLNESSESLKNVIDVISTFINAS